MSTDRHSKVVLDLIGHSVNGVEIHSAEPVSIDAPEYADADDSRSDKPHFYTGPAPGSDNPRGRPLAEVVLSEHCAGYDQQDGE